MKIKLPTHRLILLLASLCSVSRTCPAQDLAPRSYLITPAHSNAVTLTYSLLDGNIQLDAALPITGATAQTQISTVSYYHSFGLFGRSTNFTIFAPYGIGNFHGAVAGAQRQTRRSGLLAPDFRLSVNLFGGPATTLRDFAAWSQKTLVGISFRLVPPAGQYDPAQLINLGTNRWAFKPEVGYSYRTGHWILDAYGGAWFFTENRDFYFQNALSSGKNVQKEMPVGSFEAHLSYDFRPRFWLSLDGNFWFGGRTSLNGLPNPATAQRNSRVGASASIPVSTHQSLKFSYNDGAYIRYGGNYQAISVGWQYSWVGRPD